MLRTLDQKQRKALELVKGYVESMTTKRIKFLLISSFYILLEFGQNLNLIRARERGRDRVRPNPQ